MTTSTLLFNKLTGSAIVKQNPLAYESEVNMTGPEVVQSGRVSDLLNIPSAASVGVYTAKSLFAEHLPYIMEGSVVIFNNHFIRELRRQWSGVVTGTGYFSPKEKTLYDQFILYENGLSHDGTLDPILAELDFWLVEEIQENPHPSITRQYAEDHPWMKIHERTI